MKNAGANIYVSRVVAAAVSLIAPLVMVEQARAQAACTQAAPVPSGTPVTCSGGGPVTANDPNGWGTGVETGVNIIVDSDPANPNNPTNLTGTNAGIFAHDAIVDNRNGSLITSTGNGFGIFVDSVTLTNGVGSKVSGSNGITASSSVTVSGNDGTIEGTGASGIGISVLPGGSATVTNGTGSITGIAGGIAARFVTLLGNDGNIEAATTDASAISATGNGSADITNGNGTIQANAAGGIAISSDGEVTLRANGPGGKIQALGGTDLIGFNKVGGIAISGNTVGIAGNDGLIEGSGLAAVSATGHVSLFNGAGTIRATGAGGNAIMSAQSDITISGNNGTIEATGANGAAVSAATSLDVINGAGATIQAKGAGGIALNALSGTGSARISANGIGGHITGDTFAIQAQSVFVSSNDGTIEALDAGSATNPVAAVRALTDAHVNNGATGTIQALGPGGMAISVRISTGPSVATVANAGQILGNAAAISADNVLVTGNSGTIGAADLAQGATAIKASVDADVTNGSGTIEANGAGGVAIGAGGTAKVDNGSGTIEANAQGGIAIFANIVNVIGNVGTIEATASDGVAIQASTSGSVHNLANGKISGGHFGISGLANTNFDVTNDAGAIISGGFKGISLQGQGLNTVTNAGTISGTAASVEFLGSGTNRLTLQAGSTLTGTAFGSTAAGATNQLVLRGGGTANNDFQNFNSLTLKQDGRWILNGNSVVGATTLEFNTELTVGDGSNKNTLLTGDVTLGNASALSGMGTIDGNVNVMGGGKLRPGFSTGTLTVNKDVNFSAGSTFFVTATPTEVSQLSVGGKVTVDPTAAVFVQGPSLSTGFAPSTRYTILTTTGSSPISVVSGKFGSVTSTMLFLTPTLTYDDPKHVFLTLALNGSGGGGGGGGGDPGGGGGTGGGGTGGGGGGTGGGTTSAGSVFARVAQTRNQIAVTRALDASVVGASTVTNPMLLALLTLTNATDPRQAVDALSGEVFGSVQNTQATHMHFTRDTMLGRMRQATYYGAPGELAALSFGGPELAYAGDNAGTNAMAAVPGKAPSRPVGPSRDLTFWAQGLGGWGHADSDGNAASVKSRFGGFLSGADARLGDTWRAGLVAGYMRTDLNVDARSSSAGIDSVQFGGYAGGRLGAFNVRGGASYSYDSIDTSRSIFFPGFTDKANAHFHGNLGQVFGEVGYGMTFGSVAVEPLAGLAYVHVRDGSFAETGGLAALSASSANESTGYSTLGVRAATALPLANGTVLIPRGSVQWQYAFGDVTPVTALAFQSTGTSFTVAGIPIARSTALVEGGFDWRFSPQAKIGVFYQGEIAAHAESHAFKGAFTWDF